MAKDTEQTVPEADAPEAPARPDWLPERYADEAAFVKAFDEGERLRGRQADELGQLRDTVEALEAQITAQQEQPQQQFYGQDPFNQLAADIGRAYEEGDYGRALALQASLQQAQFGQMLDERLAKLPGPEPQDEGMIYGIAVNDLRAKHGEDFDRLFEKTDQIWSERFQPAKGTRVTKAQAEQGIETAFYLAQREELVSQHAARQQEQQAAEASARAKEQAQSMTGTGPRPLPRSEQEKVWDEIRNAGPATFRPSGVR